MHYCLAVLLMSVVGWTTPVVEKNLWYSPNSASCTFESWRRCGAAALCRFARFRRRSQVAVISRTAAQRRLVDDFLGLFGGQAQPVMVHLIEAGKLRLEDVLEAEKILRDLAKKGNTP
jgi:hypothetical protein